MNRQVVATALVILLSWTTPLSAQAPLPKPDHIVIVIEENHSFAQIIDSPAAPYLNSLARKGALLTNSYGVTHPSQPNYIALFAGTIDGVSRNSCPTSLTAPNLRSTLALVDRTFAGYAEDLPTAGAVDCVVGAYARKHNPWVNWQSSPINTVPAEDNRPFSDFPADFTRLPTVSFVIPNQLNDMHDGKDPDRIQRADQWLHTHLDRYVEWAQTHNSLLIITWDEDNGKSDNHIPTILVGPMVRPGRYGEPVDHYGLLRTITEMYGAKPIGLSRQAFPLSTIWATPGLTP
ncbi:MAG: acid phosphatase [Nitrospira sp. CR2.1]|nr:acid phosphatase [Nitrospira sp. CR2.1]